MEDFDNAKTRNPRECVVTNLNSYLTYISDIKEVSLYKRTNVVQSQKFSEKITQLMNSYYNGLITNEEVIKELLKTAQEITELYNNGKKLGLT